MFRSNLCRPCSFRTMTRHTNRPNVWTRVLTPLLMLCVLWMGVLQANADTLTVSSLADDGSAGTLRSRINTAPSGSTINITATGTIWLTKGQLEIYRNLRIIGPGADKLKINAHYASRVLFVQGSIGEGSTDVNISGLTLSEGLINDDGGGIYNFGALTLTGITLSDNFALNGGAIHNYGTLKIAGSTLSNNSANRSGGGLFNAGGTLTLTNSTVSKNLLNSGSLSHGGGIYNQGATTVTNSTLSDNRGEAIYHEYGSLNLTSSIVASNSPGGVGNIVSTGTGTIASGGYNLSDDNASAYLNQSSDLNSTNPLLGALAFNGGPTQTMKLLGGSPAINAGSSRDGLGADQRGYSRQVGAGTDIGAFEVQAPVAADQTLSVGKNGTFNGTLTATADNDSTLTYSKASDPAHGSVSVNLNGTFSYTPTLNYQGTDSFTFSANNGLATSNVATVSISVNEASSLVVNTSSDASTNSDDVTSLREAIAYANSGTAGLVPTITFSVTGTITLSGAELVIAHDLTISGPGASLLTISGNNASRIFNVQSGTVNISGLTLSAAKSADGVYGSAIYNQGTLNVSGSTLSGNSGEVGAGIFNSGTLMVTRSTFSNNGGQSSYGAGSGICNIGIATVANSTFSNNNNVGNGGGIYSQGTLTVSSSTFSGNSAGQSGGGIFAAGTATVTNSTLSNNSSANGDGGGIYIYSDSQNQVQATLNLLNSIVARNSATNGPDIKGTVASGDYNLVGNLSGATLPGTHNLTGVNPNLGALAFNGGPTQTMALLGGSPALNAGGSNAPATDQRGFARVGAPDIGAFEEQDMVQSGANFVVSSTADTDDGICGIGNCTLREAVNAANSNADASAITFDPTAFAAPRKTITLGSGLTLTRQVTITGPPAGVTVAGANQRLDLFTVNIGVSAGFNGLTLRNSHYGIVNYGTAAVTGCTLSGNVQGGLGNGGNTATVTNCTLSGNTNYGLFNISATLNLTNCTLTGNGYYGVYNYSGTANVNNSLVAGNGSANVQGAITGSNNITSGSAAQAGLDPRGLQENGGPTPTIALLGGSPAINAGGSNAPATDQRGLARVGTPDIGAFELDVLPNAAPTLTKNGGLTLDEGASATIDKTKLQATDAEQSADQLTFTLTAIPANGTLKLNGTALAVNGTFTQADMDSNKLFYGHNGGETTADTFKFTLSDGKGGNIGETTFKITINAVNDAPVARAQSVSTNEDTAKAITLAASDIDGDALTYSIVAAPTNGTLTGSGSSRTYTPNANFNGTDSFSFKANDGIADSNVATVNISIAAVNDAPVASAQSVSTNEDTTKAITLTGSDVDGNTLIYSLVSGPSRGSLSGTGSTRTYAPALNYNGTDFFTFKVSDGFLGSNTATVSITVNAVNDAPVAVNDVASASKNGVKLIPVLANDSDVDGDTLSIASVTATTNGTVVISGKAVNFTPRKGFTGNASFSYTISDGKGGTSTATVVVTVTKESGAMS